MNQPPVSFAQVRREASLLGCSEWHLTVLRNVASAIGIQFIRVRRVSPTVWRVNGTVIRLDGGCAVVNGGQVVNIKADGSAA